MKRTERLDYLARKLYEIGQKQKTVEQERSELKDKFFELLEDELFNKQHLLPVRTIEVPQEFFDKTEMSKEEFSTTRFPGWAVEHCEHNTATGATVFVFKKDPGYVPDVIELLDGDHVIRVSKEIQEYTPEIDWTTLEKERPDLFSRLAQPVVTYEPDPEELEKMIEEFPEDLAVLQRHFKVRQPARKVVARRVKGERDTLV